MNRTWKSYSVYIYYVTVLERSKVAQPAQYTGFFVTHIDACFECRSVGWMSVTIIKLIPKVVVDRIGSGRERQDESWSN